MSPTTKLLLQGVLGLCVTYSLCLFFSGLALLGLVYEYATKRHLRFWVPKEHVKPAALSDPRYGEHKFITVNGVKLHCVIKGSADKPLMLFVHGFPEFWYSWRYQIDEFSRDYRTVAFDMRGYGDSDKPAGLSPYRLEQLITDIRDLIPALGHKTCTLVCHDWGAVVGWTFVQHHMHLVDRYVMMGAPSPTVWKRSITSSLDQFRKSWYIFFFQMPFLPEFVTTLYDYRMFKSINLGGIGGSASEEDLEAYKYTFSQPGAMTTPLNFYRANLRHFDGLGAGRSVKPTKYAPGLFILGEKDLYISSSSGPALQKVFEDLRFETVPGANHFVQQDAPAATNALMRKFLSE